MNKKSEQNIWEKIEAEERTDRLIRKLSKIAWAATLLFVVIYAVITAIEFFKFLRLYNVGAVSIDQLMSVLMPFILIIGGIFLIIAILSTIGVFLRLRTSSLSEIQLRLSRLEEIFSRSSEQGE